MALFEIQVNCQQFELGWAYRFLKEFDNAGAARTFLKASMAAGLIAALKNFHHESCLIKDAAVRQLDQPGVPTLREQIRVPLYVPGHWPSDAAPGDEPGPDRSEATLVIQLAGVSPQPAARRLSISGLPDRFSQRSTTGSNASLFANEVAALLAILTSQSWLIKRRATTGAFNRFQVAQINRAADGSPLYKVTTRQTHGLAVGNEVRFSGVRATEVAPFFGRNLRVEAGPAGEAPTATEFHVIFTDLLGIADDTAGYDPHKMFVRRDGWVTVPITRGHLVSMGTRQRGRVQTGKRGARRKRTVPWGLGQIAAEAQA